MLCLHFVGTMNKCLLNCNVLKGTLTMCCLHLVGTMVYFLLNDGLEEGEVNNAVFISYWDHNLVSAKGWWL